MDELAPPQKKIKLDDGSAATTTAAAPEEPLDALEHFFAKAQKEFPEEMLKAKMNLQSSSRLPENCDPAGPAQLVMQKEFERGIIESTTTDYLSLSGILKQRYTDFLVNEIGLDGQVIHLHKIIDRHETSNVQKHDQTPTKANGKTAEIPPAPEATAKMAEQNAVSSWQAFGKSNHATIHPQNEALLMQLMPKESVDALQDLYNRVAAAPGRKPEKFGTVSIPKVDDKEARGKIHQGVREAFGGKLSSFFDDKTGEIVVKAGYERRRAQKGYVGDKKRGEGDYLHFTAEKTNRDTLEPVMFAAKVNGMQARATSFAGNKDRRAVTVQRYCIHKLNPAGLAKAQRQSATVSYGDLKYEKQPLKLGDLKGNEFVVTMRDVKINNPHMAILAKHYNETAPLVEQIAKKTAEAIKTKGFINYYGRQRFGTLVSSTHQVGIHMLRGEYEEAVDAILEFSDDALKGGQGANSDQQTQTSSAGASSLPINVDYGKRALAIDLWRQGKTQEALGQLPRKFTAENAIIRHMKISDKTGDFQGALQAIPRNLRLIYVHAYQSLIWNLAASHRYKTWGNVVLEGDLVLVNEHKDKEGKKETANEAVEPIEEVDADGEIVVQPAANDRVRMAGDDDDIFERARALTAEEAASGKYTVFDVVLPTPGFDIIYPPYMVDFYKDTMSKDEHGGIDPFDMRRKWRDISLPGSYRKLLSRPEDGMLDVKVHEYEREFEQFVDTDRDRIIKAEGRELPYRDPGPMIEGGGKKIALVLRFRLGTAQYATMLLRELMKGGVLDHNTEFLSG